MFAISEGSAIAYTIAKDKFDAVIEWRNSDGSYTVRHKSGSLSRVPAECIDLVCVKVLYVVSWIKDGRPGTKATFDNSEALALHRKRFEQGALAWLETHSLGAYWVQFN